ncbi:hypothetical protein Hanom_Chr07g00613061 [Helianthus anomalus]
MVVVTGNIGGSRVAMSTADDGNNNGSRLPIQPVSHLDMVDQLRTNVLYTEQSKGEFTTFTKIMLSQ